MTETGFLETLNRVEAVNQILNRIEDVDDILKKMTTIEQMLIRFGSLEELMKQFDTLKADLFLLKDLYTVEEAAKFMHVSTGHVYRLTSTHELSYTKPSGKLIFFERKELERWMRQNPVISKREAEHLALVASMEARASINKK
jgi:excisionase family DNA binding protein